MSSEYLNVHPDEDHSDGNPYSALIVTEEDFEHGRVRIQPPFTVSEEFLHTMTTGDIGVTLEFEIGGQEATILGFSADTDSVFVKKDGNKECARYTVQRLLNELGRVANADLLKAEFGIS